MCKIWLQLLEHTTVGLLLYENMLACRAAAAAAGLFGSAVPERIIH